MLLLTSCYVVSISITIVTMVYLFVVSIFIIGCSIGDSSWACQAVYLFCASFWLAGKLLLHVWYNEKLYYLRCELHLVRSRLSVQYVVDNFILGAPYVLALCWIFGAYVRTF